MAYVQEVVVNAFLEAIHEDREPREEDLQKSLKAIKEQHASVKKDCADVNGKKDLGFVGNGNNGHDEEEKIAL